MRRKKARHDEKKKVVSWKKSVTEKRKKAWHERIQEGYVFVKKRMSWLEKICVSCRGLIDDRWNTDGLKLIRRLRFNRIVNLYQLQTVSAKKIYWRKIPHTVHKRIQGFASKFILNLFISIIISYCWSIIGYFRVRKNWLKRWKKVMTKL